MPPQMMLPPLSYTPYAIFRRTTGFNKQTMLLLPPMPFRFDTPTIFRRRLHAAISPMPPDDATLPRRRHVYVVTANVTSQMAIRGNRYNGFSYFRHVFLSHAYAEDGLVFMFMICRLSRAMLFDFRLPSALRRFTFHDAFAGYFHYHYLLSFERHRLTPLPDTLRRYFDMSYHATIPRR